MVKSSALGEKNSSRRKTETRKVLSSEFTPLQVSPSALPPRGGAGLFSPAPLCSGAPRGPARLQTPVRGGGQRRRDSPGVGARGEQVGQPFQLLWFPRFCCPPSSGTLQKAPLSQPWPQAGDRETAPRRGRGWGERRGGSEEEATEKTLVFLRAPCLLGEPGGSLGTHPKCGSSSLPPFPQHCTSQALWSLAQFLSFQAQRGFSLYASAQPKFLGTLRFPSNGHPFQV